MQAVTMTGELVMAEAAEASVATAKLWARRIAMGAMLAAGIAATVYILGHMGALVVYGLPAPFLRRVPARAVAVA
jgi:cell division protein FtsW (lipid II flippase)